MTTVTDTPLAKYIDLCKQRSDEVYAATCQRMEHAAIKILRTESLGDDEMLGLAVLTMNMPSDSDCMSHYSPPIFKQVRTFLAAASDAQKSAYRRTCMSIASKSYRDRMQWFLGEI